MTISSHTRKIRYGVAGLGYISQAAVLPAFAHAGENSELVLLFSEDRLKRKELGTQYGVPALPYDDYDAYLAAGAMDAVYIALPNTMHRDFAMRAMRAGVHVLCEKPLASSVRDSKAMVEAASKYKVKLMTAYRLHFEEANMKAVEIVRSGKIGKVRYFHSLFSQQVSEGNIRLKKHLGGGSLWDLGIYCINAARYLFRAEPLEVTAMSANDGQKRFSEVDEMTSAILRFPGEGLASFTSSFGAADIASYQVVGTKGDIRLDPAYEYAEGLVLHQTIEGKTEKFTFGKRDQFAPELVYFSQCILERKMPEASGQEGLADVAIIEALYHSAKTGKTVPVSKVVVGKRPSQKQVITKPALKKPRLLHAQPASR